MDPPHPRRAPCRLCDRFNHWAIKAVSSLGGLIYGYIEGLKLELFISKQSTVQTKTTTTIITIIIMMMVMIKIIALKDEIRDFLHSPHCAANRLQHVRLSGPGAIVYKSCATHQALITCNMSCYVPRGTKGQLSY